MKCKVKIEIARYQGLLGPTPALAVAVKTTGLPADKVALVNQAAAEAAEKLAAILEPGGRG